ncbi:MAG: pilin [Patescibacteria group bacterium]|nr:pilin [Patescibacteria group bacterium]
MRKKLLYSTAIFALLLLFFFIGKENSYAQACGTGGECGHSNPIMGCEYGYSPVADGRCTSGICCKKTPTCAAPADCNNSNLMGCVNGYSPVDGTCANTQQKCCKKTPTCAAPASCIDKVGGIGGCPFTYTPADGTCTNTQQKCCKQQTGPGNDPPAGPPCASKDNDGKCLYVNTGLNIPIGTNPQSLIQKLFGLILSISGGIALLLIIISGYKVLASQGNPEALKGAREQLTAAIVGLLFIILALVILQIIGVDILHLPGFGTGPVATSPPSIHPRAN